MNERMKPVAHEYLMPAEWERHEGTWLAWPKDPLTFPEEISTGTSAACCTEPESCRARGLMRVHRYRPL